ncbi:MAG: hypothetical protein M1830_005743, partial [Pleopsidium flavum]
VRSELYEPRVAGDLILHQYQTPESPGLALLLDRSLGVCDCWLARSSWPSNPGLFVRIFESLYDSISHFEAEDEIACVIPTELAGVDGRENCRRDRSKLVYLESHTMQFVRALFGGYYDSRDTDSTKLYQSTPVAIDYKEYTTRVSFCILRNGLVHVDCHRDTVERKVQKVESGSRSKAESRHLLLRHGNRVHSDRTRNEVEDIP